MIIASADKLMISKRDSFFFSRPVAGCSLGRAVVLIFRSRGTRWRDDMEMLERRFYTRGSSSARGNTLK